jgi:hypothetical protein
MSNGNMLSAHNPIQKWHIKEVIMYAWDRNVPQLWPPFWLLRVPPYYRKLGTRPKAIATKKKKKVKKIKKGKRKRKTEKKRGKGSRNKNHAFNNLIIFIERPTTSWTLWTKALTVTGYGLDLGCRPCPQPGSK